MAGMEWTRKNICCGIMFILITLAIITRFPASVEVTENEIPKNIPVVAKQEQTIIWTYSDHSLNKFLKPPLPKKFSEPVDKTYAQMRQDEIVYDILKKKNGFYIELGACNGKEISNTIWLERKHNWTGLLIEANRDLCDKIDRVGRNAWRLCACISNERNVTFVKGGGLGGDPETLQKDIRKRLGTVRKEVVPCFTLQEVLSKIKVSHIDYFSLDVEGAEFVVLETLRNSLKLNEITISVWTIEYRIYDGRRDVNNESQEKLHKLRLFFKEIGGYVEHSQIDSKQKHVVDGTGLDVVFVRSAVWCENNKMFPNGTACVN